MKILKLTQDDFSFKSFVHYKQQFTSFMILLRRYNLTLIFFSFPLIYSCTELSSDNLSLAKSALAKGDTTLSVYYFRETVQSDSLNKFANEFLANYYSKKLFSSTVDKGNQTGKKKLDSAKYFYSVLVSIDSSNLEYHRKLALIYVDLQEYTLAIKTFRFLSEKMPDDETFHYNIGICKIHSEDFHGAVASFSTVLRIAPNHQLALFQRAVIKSKILYGEALEHAEKFVYSIRTYREYTGIVGPQFRPYFEKFYSLKVQPIIDDLNLLLALNPTHLRGLFKRAEVFRYMGSYSLAIKDYDSCITLKPDFGLAYANRGLTKNYAGRKEEACIDFSIGVEFGSSEAQDFMNEFCY